MNVVVFLVAMAMAFALLILGVLSAVINGAFSEPLPLIIEYAEIIHTHGVESNQAKKFIARHSDDEDFVRRARTLNRLVRKFK